jgi:putative ATP-dependent endonuclease of the OLD family
MYLKRLKLTNYRKFSTEQNVVEFVSSKILKKENETEGDIADIIFLDEAAVTCEEISSELDQIDVASDTTLIIGKNNAGKTTIITALSNLINHGNAFGASDFNYRYLKDFLSNYDIINPPKELPYIEFVITIELEENSNDRISNLIPFMLVEDVNDSELDICIRYEIVDAVFFQSEIKNLILKDKGDNLFGEFLKLLRNTDFELNYYDKNHNRLDIDFKLSNLMELQCIKANHLRNDHCLTDAFNKIINYRYEHVFKGEKVKVSKSLEEINDSLTCNIRKNHTNIISNVLKELISKKHMGVDLSADITFEKLMRDLIKYEYIEDDVNIPENQFGLGYTNLVMIIAAIMDYMERYPNSSFNSKVNLISIEEPETFMHPQMQELFIKNINEAIRVLLSSKDKDVNSQIIITTHSSHILNSKIHSANTFNNICYLYEEDQNAVVTNLSNKKVMPFESEDENSESFKFLKKHIKYKVSELFFTDAAIFVEGFAEDMIIPYYIEKREVMSKFYISMFNINGAHGFLYKRLVEALGIPVLIITDLDIKRQDENEDDIDIDDKKSKKATTFPQINCLKGKETTNATIIDFYGSTDLSDIPLKIEIGNLYLAYQGEINGYYATSFEEALILTNYDNDILNDLLKEMKPRIYSKVTGDMTDYNKNIESSYMWQAKLEKNKGEFASKLLYKVVNEEVEDKVPKLPKYIADGLDWLERKLGGE